MNSILTLNARDYVLLEVIQSTSNISSLDMHNEINTAHEELIEILQKKKIPYHELKTCLVPSNKKNEVVLVFDRSKIKEMYYGSIVFQQIFKFLINEKTNHSVLAGDYIGENKIQDLLYEILLDKLNDTSKFNYTYSQQFYMVYINNMSNSMVDKINNYLETFLPYVGYANLTYQSKLKTYLSNILPNTFLKYKNNIIVEHEDYTGHEKDLNMYSYDFEKYGFKCRSVDSRYFNLFLAYKIECEVFKNNAKDREFAIKSMSDNIIDLENCEIKIEENKLNYLKSDKSNQFKKSDIELNKDNLTYLIKKKLLSNYIYNMRRNEYGNMIFNISIDIINTIDENNKMLLSLEYIPNNKILRLITMY